MPHLVVLGHLHLDVSGRDVHSVEGGDSLSLAKVTVAFGGSVAHVGGGARGRCRLTAICGVGGDAIGSILERHAQATYDHAIVLRKDADSASVVSILYRGDRREMIGPVGSANDRLSASDLEAPEVAAALRSADILFVDGYLATGRPGRDACRAALACARAAGAMTVLDVVPHTADRFYPIGELTSLAENADVLVIEAGTMAGFAGLDGTDRSPDAVARAFRSAFPHSLGILRYGERNIGLNRFVSAAVDVLHDTTTPTHELSRAGYGDRLLVDQALSLWADPARLGIPHDALPWAGRKAATR